MRNSETLKILPLEIKGPLSHQEAEEVLFKQISNGTNITCVLEYKKGMPVVKTENPQELVEVDNMHDFGGLYAAMQESEMIIIHH